MKAEEITKEIRGIFPKAMIVCRETMVHVAQNFDREILAILNIKHCQGFSRLISMARRFFIDVTPMENWNQIEFTFELPVRVSDPGIVIIMERGELETFDYHHTSSEEFKKRKEEIDRLSGPSERYQLSEDFDPEDFDSVARETELIRQWSDRKYHDYSLAGIDKLARWKKLREIAVSGDFPFELNLIDPKAKTEEYTGLFKLTTEFEDEFHWTLRGQEKEDFAGLCKYAEDIVFSSDIEEDYADLEIVFSVEVFSDELKPQTPGNFFFGIRMED